MPIVPLAPPQAAPVRSSFDYVTVDSQRRRVYAAHGGAARALLVVDADSGKVLANISVGGAPHGVAVEPLGGHVFVGLSEGKIEDVDPETRKVVRVLDVGGPVDAIAYDSVRGRIYADEDDGTKMWVVDAQTFRLVGTVPLPGHKPEYLAVDPVTHDVYQNIDSENEIVVVDPQRLTVRSRFKTPALEHNHPLQYDAIYGEIVAGGSNGVIAAYDRAGNELGHVTVQPQIDQCDLDSSNHQLACAGYGFLTVLELQPHAAPRLLGSVPIAEGVHTVGADSKTQRFFAVWSRPDGEGDYVQMWRYEPNWNFDLRKTPPRSAASPTADPPR